MKAGDKALIDGQKRIWVICPDCSEGRWVIESSAKEARFSGRCRKCYMVETRRDMAKYFPTIVQKEVYEPKD